MGSNAIKACCFLALVGLTACASIRAQPMPREVRPLTLEELASALQNSGLDTAIKQECAVVLDDAAKPLLESAIKSPDGAILASLYLGTGYLSWTTATVTKLSGGSAQLSVSLDSGEKYSANLKDSEFSHLKDAFDRDYRYFNATGLPAASKEIIHDSCIIVIASDGNRNRYFVTSSSRFADRQNGNDYLTEIEGWLAKVAE